LTKRGGVTTAGLLLGLMALIPAQGAIDAALGHLDAPGWLIDVAYVACFVVVFRRLVEWAGRRHPRFGKRIHVTDRSDSAITADAPK
jgi:hypothetical protein